MIEIVVLGGPGGGAMAAQSVARLAASGRALRVVGLLNDALATGTAVAGAAVLGRFESWREQPERTVFIAPLHKAKEMQRRSARIAGLGIPARRWTSVIDAAAVVAVDATVGQGTYIGAFCVVDVGARLGKHVSLWPAAQVGHDAAVGDFVFFGRGAIASARCAIATGAHIGPGAVVREDCRIGRFAVIGAGAVVVRDVPDHAVVAGNPARPIGTLDAGEDPPGIA